MSDGKPVLELAEVHKVYPSSPPVKSLRGVSLTIRDGEFVSVIGPSGSGKTTLLHVMAALDRPTSGSVRITGREASTLSDAELSGLRAHALGFVFQQFSLLENLTALDNVATGLLYRGINDRDRKARATIALERVGLGHRLQHRPQKLSGGERQRVSIARALVGRPAIVLADEPTGNLDSETGAALLELLSDLNREGMTLVVVTHSAEVAAAADRGIEIRDGRLTRDASR